MPVSFVPSSRWDKVRGVLFLIVGLGLLLGAVYAGSQTRRFIQRSETAPGLVTRLEFGPAHGEVRFTTREGRAVVYSQNGEVWLRKGQAVRVRYDPTQPEQTPVVDQFGALWGTTLTLSGMGAIFALAGAGLSRKAIRARRAG